MLVSAEIDECRRAVRQAHQDGQPVGLVPTMGALHEGHLSLIRAAKARCSTVAVTIFVNPTQFGPNDDLNEYPRTLEADLQACRAAGVDLVFAPKPATMYLPDEATTVHVRGLTESLCGRSRQPHFDGVATVVVKLFNILPATMAFFGEKDYQQLVVVKRAVRDLNIPIEIVACPTVREPDGLAFSSRNQHLLPDERKQATSLSRALFAAAKRISAGEQDTAGVVQGIRDEILRAGPAEIDYIDVVDAMTLAAMTIVDRPARICVAVRIGACRLIDNVGVDRPAESK